MNHPQQIRTTQTQPPRAKEPTDLQLRHLKSTLQTLPLSPNHSIHYNLSTKQSKSGFFSNDRLIVLNTQSKELGYLSKIPEYMIPFYKEEEVSKLKYKAKVSREQVKNGEVKEFRCQPLHGKIATFQVYYTKGNRGDVEQWVMEMKTPKLMHQWVELINNALLQDQIPQPEPEVKEEPPMQVIEEEPSQPESKKKLQSHKVLNQYLEAKQADPQNQYLNNNQFLNPHEQLQPVPLSNSIINNLDDPLSNSNQNSSRIANMPFYDHVTELKYLRKNQPEKFNTTNEMSHKKLPEVKEQQTVQEKYQRQVEDIVDYSKKPYYEEAQVDPYPRRQKSHTRFEDIGNVHEVRAESKKQLSNSYLVSEPVHNSRSISPLPHQRNNYESGSQYKRYQEDSHHQPEISVSRPQDLPRYPSKVSQQSSRPNITIEDKYRNIPNVIIEESSTPSYDMKPAERIPRVNNFMSRGSNIKSSRSQQSSRRGLARKRWNQIFAETSNKLQIYEEFVHSCFNVVRDIVNELPLDTNRKDYLPIEARSPYYVYHHEGILLTLHKFDTSNSSSTPTIVPNAPLLFEQNTYELLKREFYNYNLILSVTANEGFIKVPLCAYFEYKGIIALCKAEIPEAFSEVTPQRYQQQFSVIQEQMHLRFIFGAFNSYAHPNGKYVLLDNMNELIPEIPVGSKGGHFFRKEFLLTSQKMFEDVNDVHQANDMLVAQVLPELLGRLESMETYVVNESDLLRLFHEQGLSLAYLPQMIQSTTSPFLKRLLLTQLVSITFIAIFRSEIHSLYESFSTDYARCTLQELNHRLMDSTHVLLDMLFGYSTEGQQMWKVIVEQCKVKYRVSVSKEDLMTGYLLSSVIERIGLNCNFRHSSFNKYEVDFFVKANNIPRDLMLSFRVKVRRYDLSSLSPLVQDIHQTLGSPPTPQNFKALVSSLNLKHDPIPNYLQCLQEQILTYLCNFVPYSEHDEFQHLGIYNMVLLEPHTYYSTKCSLLAIKWCVKKRYFEEAVKIYEMKELENAFWQGQYNPAITEFYDFFSMFYVQNGQYEHSIQLARMSLKNVMKVAGPSALPVADKHYQLGNIYFKMGKKQQALKEYSRTKDVLQAHNQTHIPEHGVILLKLAVLYLNFGKIPEAVNNSLEALGIFDSTAAPEEDQIGTFEVLARCYEIIKKPDELDKLCSLAAEKFNLTESCLTFARMTKLGLHSSLKRLSTPEARSFISVATRLEKQCSNCTQMEAFSYLNKICQSQILMRKIDHYLQNIIYFCEQAQRKDLFRRYKSLEMNPHNEVEEMLVIFEAVGILVGFEFMIGSMGEFYE